MGFQKDIALISVMILSKLSASADDVVWLFPFLKFDRKNSFIYLIMMALVCGFAILLSFGGVTLLTSVLGEDGYWNAPRVLSLAGSIALMIFACWLFYDDHFAEEENESDSELSSGDFELMSHPSQVELLDAEKFTSKLSQMRRPSCDKQIPMISTIDEATVLETDAGQLNEVKILAHTEVSVDADVAMEYLAGGAGDSSKSEEDLNEDIRPPKRRLSARRSSLVIQVPGRRNSRRESIPRSTKVVTPRPSSPETQDRRNSRRRSLPKVTDRMRQYSELSDQKDSDQLPNDAPPIEKQQSRGSLLETMKNRISLLDQKRASLTQHLSDMSIAMQEINAEKYTRKRLCVTCILGSMDDLVIQTILLISNTVQWYHLLIGNFLGSLIVLIVCFLGSKLPGFSECMSCFPLWLVIGIFSIYCLVFTFLD